MPATVEAKNGNLIITIPMNKEGEMPESSTGKSLTVANTGGFIPTDVKVGNKVVKISVNAIIPKN